MYSYIFGYGSLIHIPIGEEKSHVGYARLQLGSSMRRAWNTHSTCSKTGQKYTAVGLEWALPSEASHVNGRIFTCTPEQLEFLHQREKDYYSVRLPSGSIQFLTPIESPLPANTPILSFMSRYPQRPTEEYPINMTYLNTCVEACAVVNAEFAEEFILTSTPVYKEILKVDT
jgi:hypothetical protein